MIKSLGKKTAIGLVLLITVLGLSFPQVNAASSTKTITTQKQLTEALKSKNVDKIVIKPKKATTFTISNKTYGKDLVVYQKNTTLVNGGKFDHCEIVVTNNTQTTKAVEYLNKYQKSIENRIRIQNAKSDIVIPKTNLGKIASLSIENSNCDIKNKANWETVDIKDMGNGAFTEYCQGNKITVTGDIEKITVSDIAKITRLYYNQEEDNLETTMENSIEINGEIESIVTASNLDLLLSGANLANAIDFVDNETDDNIVVYIEEEKYILDKDNKIVIEEENTEEEYEEEDLEEEDFDDEDFEEDYSDDEYADAEYGNEYQSGNEEQEEQTTKDEAYDYKEYTIKLKDGTTSTVYGYFDEQASYQVYLKVNELRASLGLNSLEWDTAMLEGAKTRSSELIQSYNHTRPNGTSCFTVYNAQGVSYGRAGENIAAGYANADAVMSGWTNSPGHYANMTYSGYKKIIVGCIIAKDESDAQGYKYYWVQLFRN